jgi:hypothetical protein
VWRVWSEVEPEPDALPELWRPEAVAGFGRCVERVNRNRSVVFTSLEKRAEEKKMADVRFDNFERTVCKTVELIPGF